MRYHERLICIIWIPMCGNPVFMLTRVHGRLKVMCRREKFMRNITQILSYIIIMSSNIVSPCAVKRVNINMLSYQSMKSHHKDNTVPWTSYLCNLNSYVWKPSLWIETGSTDALRLYRGEGNRRLSEYFKQWISFARGFGDTNMLESPDVSSWVLNKIVNSTAQYKKQNISSSDYVHPFWVTVRYLSKIGCVDYIHFLHW